MWSIPISVGGSASVVISTRFFRILGRKARKARIHIWSSSNGWAPLREKKEGKKKKKKKKKKKEKKEKKIKTQLWDNNLCHVCTQGGNWRWNPPWSSPAESALATWCWPPPVIVRSDRRSAGSCSKRGACPRRLDQSLNLVFFSVVTLLGPGHPGRSQWDMNKEQGRDSLKAPPPSKKWWEKIFVPESASPNLTWNN